MEARHGVQTPDEQHEDGVEIHTAQIGSEAPAPAQPIGVGEVTEEGGPDEVDPDADHPRIGAAVASGGGVAHLVETGSNDREQTDRHQQRRLVEHLLHAGGRAPTGQHHRVHCSKGGEDGPHDDREEQEAELATLLRRVATDLFSEQSSKELVSAPA